MLSSQLCDKILSAIFHVYLPVAVNCGGNLEFQLCGPNKRKTCTDPIGANDFCVSGCFCGEGLVEDGGVCITAVECPGNIVLDNKRCMVFANTTQLISLLLLLY